MRRELYRALKSRIRRLRFDSEKDKRVKQFDRKNKRAGAGIQVLGLKGLNLGETRLSNYLHITELYHRPLWATYKTHNQALVA